MVQILKSLIGHNESKVEDFMALVFVSVGEGFHGARGCERMK